MWAYIHTKLQNQCVYLWPTPGACRTLVAQAGVDSSEMSFDEPPALRWESVILNCEKQYSLPKLCVVLLSKFPDNPNLQDAVAPWIHGNPPEGEVKKPKKPEAIPETPVVPHEEVVIMSKPLDDTLPILIETAEQRNTRLKVAGTNVEVDLVPVLVPKEFEQEAQVALVATIASLRLTIVQHEKDINELIAWREALSSLSRSETAARTGGNEKGENRTDPLLPASAAPPDEDEKAGTIAP